MADQKWPSKDTYGDFDAMSTTQPAYGDPDPHSNTLTPSVMASSAPHQIGDFQVKDIANQIKVLLDKTALSPDCIPETQIDGESDFNIKMRAYISLCDDNATDSSAKSDFPPDPKTQQQLVRELIEAMLYLGDDCEDATSKKSVNRIKKLSPIEFDLMAWKILLECRDAQQGKVSMPRWGLDWDIQHFDSFHARFEGVKSSLRVRKSMVATCFDNIFPKRMVANPRKEIKLKKVNKDVNSKRAEDLDLAKRVRQTGQSAIGTPQESPEDVQDDDVGEAGPSRISTDTPAGSEVIAGMGSGMGEVPNPEAMLEDDDLVEAAKLDQGWIEQMLHDEWTKNNSGDVVPRMF